MKLVELQQAVIAGLAAWLEDARVVREYPKGRRCPKRQAVVTVGLGELTVEKTGELATALGGREAHIGLRFGIYGEPSACHQAQEQLLHYLLFGQQEWEMRKVCCSALAYDEQTRSLCLQVEATVQLALLPEDGPPSRRFTEVMVRRTTDDE